MAFDHLYTTPNQNDSKQQCLCCELVSFKSTILDSTNRPSMDYLDNLDLGDDSMNNDLCGI